VWFTFVFAHLAPCATVAARLPWNYPRFMPIGSAGGASDSGHLFLSVLMVHCGRITQRGLTGWVMILGGNVVLQGNTCLIDSLVRAANPMSVGAIVSIAMCGGDVVCEGRDMLIDGCMREGEV
jgi:hypothetical protein